MTNFLTVTSFDPLLIQAPKGDKGDTGPAGPAGPAGADGTNGADGAAATVTVGTVTTLTPGSSVTVSNSGTTSAAVLDFGIPQGASGTGDVSTVNSVAPDGSGNVTLAASDVGAVPTTRTVNGHALSADLTLTPADLSAATAADLTSEINRAQAAEAAITVGLKFTQAAVASVSNQASLAGLPTVDGVTLTSGQIVLLTAQTTGSQNGPWAVASGSWTRPAKYATGNDAAGTSIYVEAGTTYGTSTWVVSGDGPFIIDTDATTWQQASGLGEVTAGTALSKTGNTLNVQVGTTSGTVAAGDDSRITNAVPNTRTVAGHALSANVTLSNTDISGLGTAATANTGTASGDVPLLTTGGLMPAARLGSGTADNTTYLRGDGTWATPSGGGTPTWTTPTITNGATLAGAQAVRYTKDSLGWVRIEGGFAPSATISSNATLFTLASGYRPAGEVGFAVGYYTGSAFTTTLVNILSTGDVVWRGSNITTSAQVFLSGSFYVG